MTETQEPFTINGFDKTEESQLVPIETTLKPVEAPAPPRDTLSLIHYAIEKGYGPEQLKALLEFVRQVQADEAAQKFSEALAGFQGECPPIEKSTPVKDKAGKVMYSFIPFGEIKEQIGPIMAKYGIVDTYTTVFDKGLMTTTCRIRVGRHYEESVITLGIPQIPIANDSQKAGGAMTYGQRYALVAALGLKIVGEDNDAAALESKTIAGSHVEELKALIAERKNLGEETDLKRFCGMFDCESLEQIPLKSLDLAKHELKRKIEALKKKQETK